MDKAMINNNINQVLNQMQAIEAMARNQPAQTQKTDSSGAGSFANMMQKAIDQVNTSQMQAAELGKALEMGDPNVDLAQVMVAMQKSSVSFQALTEVRNKLLTAYQDVMNMPV
jgi:flagellar hook-basal body complex protein FliE